MVLPNPPNAALAAVFPNKLPDAALFVVAVLPNSPPVLVVFPKRLVPEKHVTRVMGAVTGRAPHSGVVSLELEEKKLIF